ncbi:dihydrodipicolinate synthase family protein [Pseudorhizobium flavum]|uniref:dihydrodipicolinate synthase family protein n=1 Tax=Pseudorhizobium flavum TaxID=1335061 RepID=UPI00376F9FA7
MHRIDSNSQGVYVIAVTPFKGNGALDLEGVDRLVNFYREAGASGLTILGMMGEAPKLSQDESAAFARAVIKAAPDMPVVVGVSAPGFAAMRDLTSTVMDAGAAGVMIAPPSSLRTDEQVYGYFGQAAEVIGSDTPFVVQDFPLVTNVVISSSVLLRIFADNRNAVMLKHEDWPGLSKITALRAAEADGAKRVSILVGNGGLFLPEEMERGADGAMTGFAYPEMMVGVVDLAQKGEHERARDLFDSYLPLARYEQQPGLGLAIRKHVLCQRGAIENAHIRRPGPKLTSRDLEEIETLLARQVKRLSMMGF